ncbi:MAG: hypothetical protein L0Z48_07520 [candidate division Zixibacteria bacterium]|nr:hypothetical protein [candidate division Zixibacteria bacterium]MCI0596378.1 hypothetical protein [candidate division Zixibacteria bacterium]
MNWKLVFTLALFGVAMGIAAVLGFYPPSLEWLLWLIISLLCAWVIAKKAAVKPFLHGFMVGLLDGLAAPIITVIFFSTYLANNPSYADQAKQLPAGLDMRTFSLILAPIIGVVYGLVLGLLAWLAGKIFKKPMAATPGA